MTPSLKQAIDGVYTAFRDAPKPVSVQGCPCCLDEADIKVLLSKPLRGLLPGDLTHYASSVFLTVGAVEDFHYFLPRILELLVTERGWWPDPEIVTRAIHTAGFHSWPPSRREAVLRYFNAMIDALLAIDGCGSDLDQWVCALGRMHVDLAPVLGRVAANRPRLIDYYEVNSQPLIDGRLANGFWDDAPHEQKQVVDWFRSPETQKAIKEQYGLA